LLGMRGRGKSEGKDKYREDELLHVMHRFRPCGMMIANGAGASCRRTAILRGAGEIVDQPTPQVADPRGPEEMLPAGLGEALDGVEGEVVCAQLARCEPAGDERSVIVGGDCAVDRAGAGLQR
jgi:hypothetical protein